MYLVDGEGSGEVELWDFGKVGEQYPSFGTRVVSLTILQEVGGGGNEIMTEKLW